LLDQRDRYIDELGKLIDIRVTKTTEREVSVFTTSGLQLVGAKAARLEFDAQGTITADAQWSADPAKNRLGTVSLVTNVVGSTDLTATNGIRPGSLAAFLEMRDDLLVKAQAQLDELAAAMSRALSDRTVDGAPVTSGVQTGFELDVG